jgi:hypothetical protein
MFFLLVSFWGVYYDYGGLFVVLKFSVLYFFAGCFIFELSSIFLYLVCPVI